MPALDGIDSLNDRRTRRVLYLTRTNSQQRQVMVELRKIARARPTFAVAVQGRVRSCFLADEDAEPGYYRVGLKTYGIDAELTATPRTGWQRYTFPSTGRANVLFNTGKANQRVYESEVHVVGDRTVEGRVEAGNFCAGKDRHTVYFTATFDGHECALTLIPTDDLPKEEPRTS